MREVKGDAVILLEKNLQDHPEMILIFFEKWREGYLDNTVSEKRENYL